MTRITRLALYVLLVFVLASQVVQKSSSAPSELRPYLAVPGAGPNQRYGAQDNHTSLICATINPWGTRADSAEQVSYGAWIYATG